jgi:hypothetical protein
MVPTYQKEWRRGGEGKGEENVNDPSRGDGSLICPFWDPGTSIQKVLGSNPSGVQLKLLLALLCP